MINYPLHCNKYTNTHSHTYAHTRVQIQYTHICTHVIICSVLLNTSCVFLLIGLIITIQHLHSFGVITQKKTKRNRTREKGKDSAFPLFSYTFVLFYNQLINHIHLILSIFFCWSLGTIVAHHSQLIVLNSCRGKIYFCVWQCVCVCNVRTCFYMCIAEIAAPAMNTINHQNLFCWKRIIAHIKYQEAKKQEKNILDYTDADCMVFVGICLIMHRIFCSLSLYIFCSTSSRDVCAKYEHNHICDLPTI